MHSFKSDEFKIRVLTKDDAEEYNALLRYAFQVTEADLAETGWKDDEIKQSKFPVLERADVLGCFNIIDKKEELVAQFAVYPLDMNIYGERYEVGFVTSVCTYPEYTGHGLMKKLMRKSLTRMRDSNKSFALLYPYSIPLYRGLGWEIISNKMTYVIKDRQIPTKLKEPGYVRRVQWDDEQFKKLHTHFAAKTHGCLYRNNLAWEEYFRWDEDDTMVAIYYNEDDEPCGYMVYLISSDVMHIKELIYLNREAQLGLWEYIHAHDSMIDEVRDLLPWNNGTFVIDFEKGHCALTDKNPQYHLSMSIGTFTTLLLGYKSAEKLLQMGKIQTTYDAVAKLDDILYHEIPYVSDYI